MKIINKIKFAIVISCVLSCNREENESNTTIDTTLIQNEWQTISQRIVMPNGETHLLLCETENFKNDGKFIMSYTGMSGNTIKDSSIYKLQTDKITLLFYGYNNGILNTLKPGIAKIKTLNKNLFVYHYLKDDGSIMIIDSLKR